MMALKANEKLFQRDRWDNGGPSERNIQTDMEWTKEDHHRLAVKLRLVGLECSNVAKILRGVLRGTLCCTWYHR